jgi:hypothetical protein
MATCVAISVAVTATAEATAVTFFMSAASVTTILRAICAVPVAVAAVPVVMASLASVVVSIFYHLCLLLDVLVRELGHVVSS